MTKEYKDNLTNSRKNTPSAQKQVPEAIKKPVSLIKRLASTTTQIAINDVILIFPFALAILKDIADIFIIGSIWGIGTAISICCSIMIGLYMWLVSMGGAYKKAKKIKGLFSGQMQRLLILTAGTVFEGFFMGFNWLPVQTATFLLMYFMILYERTGED